MVIKCSNMVANIFTRRPLLFLSADQVLLELIQSTTQYILKMGVSPTLSDLYAKEWNVKANIYSKGKQYLLFKGNLNFEKKNNQCLNIVLFLNYQIKDWQSLAPS